MSMGWETPAAPDKDIQPRIDRPGLLQRVLQGGPLCMIAAPAGFGKSFLATGLAGALEGATDADAADLVSGPAPSGPLVVRGVSALDAEGTRRLAEIVLSDPERRVILISGSPVQPELLDLLAHVELHRLGPDRLAFERDETRRVLDQGLVDPVPEDLVDETHEVTSGWPALLGGIIPMDGAVERLRELLHEEDPPEHLVLYVRSDILRGVSQQDVDDMGRVAVLRRPDPAALRAVLGEADRARHVAEVMSAHQLVVNRQGVVTFRAPLLRESLRAMIWRKDPSAVVQAHRRAAEHLTQRDPEGAAADIVAHYLAAGDLKMALDHMQLHADRLLEVVAADRLRGWLDHLEKEIGPLPFRSTAMLARVRAEAGDWSGSRQALLRCERSMREMAALGVGQLAIARARVAAVQAHTAWLRGLSREADTFCQRALRSLDEAPPELSSDDLEAAEAMRFDLFQLRARLLLEAGHHDQAREALDRIVQGASVSLRTRAEAHARKELGFLTAREGDVSAAIRHYEQALQLVDRQADPDLYGLLSSRIARCHLMQGRWDEARDRLREGLSVRRRAGSLSGIATTLAVFAELNIAEEQPAEAGVHFRQAVTVMERFADMKLRAEILTSYATFLAEHGQVDEAREMADRVQGLVGDLARVEPTLSALHDEARAAIAVSEGHIDDAPALLQKARDRLVRLSAHYHVARTDLLTAEVYYKQHESGRENVRPSISLLCEQACSVATRFGYHFGQRSRFRPVLELAAFDGGPESAAYLKRGAEPVTLPLSSPTPSADADTRPRFRLFGPQGERVVDAAELGRVLHKPDGAVLTVLQVDGRCEIRHRGTVTLAELKRVALPLLRALITHPGKNMPAANLTELVWGAGPYDQKARTRLKVAISRLRDMLGEDGRHIKTVRGPGTRRASSTAYRLDPAFSFLWVEPLDGPTSP